MESKILVSPIENKCQTHVACSYGYKLVFADDKFGRPFKLYLVEDAVYNFINIMVEKRKYCSVLMKKNRELVMTNKYVEDFENSAKC